MNGQSDCSRKPTLFHNHKSNQNYFAIRTIHFFSYGSVFVTTEYVLCICVTIYSWDKIAFSPITHIMVMKYTCTLHSMCDIWIVLPFKHFTSSRTRFGFEYYVSALTDQQPDKISTDSMFVWSGSCVRQDSIVGRSCAHRSTVAVMAIE